MAFQQHVFIVGPTLNRPKKIVLQRNGLLNNLIVNKVECSGKIQVLGNCDISTINTFKYMFHNMKDSMRS